MRTAFPVPASEAAAALESIRAEQVEFEQSVVAAIRKLGGEATAGDIGRELGWGTGAVRIFGRLAAMETRGTLRSRLVGQDGSERRMWRCA